MWGGPKVVTIYLLLADEPAPIPITKMFDEYNEGVGAWNDARTFVAGPCANGSWLAGLVSDFREAVLQ